MSLEKIIVGLVVLNIILTIATMAKVYSHPAKESYSAYGSGPMQTAAKVCTCKGRGCPPC